MSLITQLRTTHQSTTQATRPPHATIRHPSTSTSQLPPEPPLPTLAATVFLNAASTSEQAAGMALGEQFCRELGLDMAMHGVLDVSVQAEPASPALFHPLPLLGRWDYLIGVSILTTSEGEATCLLQAFDTRTDNTIVWGHRLHLTAATLRALSSRFAAVLLSACSWGRHARSPAGPWPSFRPLGRGCAP